MGSRLSLACDDAVRRKQEFQNQHPEISISIRIVPVGHWVAVLPGGREIPDYNLDGLLDELDRLDL
jgi:hypothetical protein